MIVIAFDPGDTTGYAVADVEVYPTGFSIHPRGDGEITFPEGVRKLLPYTQNCDVVLAEDFIPRRPLIGSRLIAVRVLGAIEVFVNGDKLILQTPSQKATISDALLEQHGLRSSSPHILDAYRHLVVFAIREMNNARKAQAVYDKTS
jgi:hypothetical protein